IFYAAPIWVEATRVKAYKDGIESSLRSCALRVISGLLTILEEAALVIAGTQIVLLNKGPLDIPTNPRCQTWMQRRHGKVNFSLTLILSGRHRFRHEEDPDWPCCGADEVAEHVLLDCLRFRVDRERFDLNEVDATTLGAKLVEDANCWGNLCGLSAVVMLKLRSMERARSNDR
ncbi:hypothetical protein KR067_003408, partial [Drosophila pandora]